MIKRVLFLFGTRPEAIKMAPLIKVFSSDNNFKIRVGVTAQHREMLDQVLEYFEIEVDYDLNIMKPGQTLHQLTSDLVVRITEDILLKEHFDLIFVQGDTTTVLAGALAAFYQKIDIAHVEAGLRSHNKYSPFPEEINRALTSKLAKYHFCPTPLAKLNLELEGIKENIFITGNTVIDALLIGIDKNRKLGDKYFSSRFSEINFSKKIILLTCHRRENFGKPFADICQAILKISEEFDNDAEIIFPVHLNPNIRKVAQELLVRKNIKLIDPLAYDQLIWMMDKSYIILTDSGGIQEEAPSLGKPVLVLREVTERTEGIEAGTAVIVGASTDKIYEYVNKLMTDIDFYESIAKIKNPYGDGTTAIKIKNIISNDLVNS